MRPYVIFGLLLLLFVAVAVHFVLRPLRQPPAGTAVATAEPDAGAGSAATAATPDAAVPAAETAPDLADAAPAATTQPETQPEATEPTANRPLMERPLRVVALGWDLITPGVWANGGRLGPPPIEPDTAEATEPNDDEVVEPSEPAESAEPSIPSIPSVPSTPSTFSVRGLDIELTVAAERVDVERALAEGGADPAGADVAIVPLTTLVAASEDLAPLAPRVFLVAGWSHGQHVLLAREWAGDGVPTTLPVGGELALVARRGSPEHFLALFVLDLAGIPADRVAVVAPDSDEIESAPLVARMASPRRGSAPVGGLRPLVTTSDATRLVPYVAVAPERFIAEQGPTLELFAEIWLAAGTEVAADVPRAARMVGAIDGAPESLDLLGPLSRQRPASLEENARLAGLSGRSGLTFERLFDAVSGLWIEAGVIAAPPRPPTPVATELVSSIVRTGLARRLAAGVAEASDSTGPGRDPDLPGDGAGLERLLLVRPAALGREAREQRAGLAFVADLFGPLQLRAHGTLDAATLEALIDGASDRYSISPERVRPSTAGLTSGIEVLRQR